MLIWLISSPVTKYFIKPLLAEQQLSLSDDASIRLNPFLMRVTLSDISLFQLSDTQQEPVLAFEELTLQVTLWQLIFKKIVISKFLLNEGSLKITQHDGHIVIAGIEVETSAKDPDSDIAQEVEQATEENPTDSSPAYQLVLPNFLLSNFHIEIERDTAQQKNKTHHIEIEKFALSQVKATETVQEGNLTLAALIDNTHLALSANTFLTSGKGDIRSNVSLSNYPVKKLARYVEQLTELKGTLSFSSNQTITLAEHGTNFRIQKAKLNIQDLFVGIEKQHFTLKSLQHNFNNLAVDIQDNTISHLAGQSSIKLTEAALIQNDSKATVAGFKQLSLDDINFVLDDEPSIDISDIILDEFLFSKKATLSDAVAQKAIDKINTLSAQDGIEIDAEDIVKLPPVMELKQLILNKLHIHQQSIAINSIVFDSLTGAIIIKENKDIANLIALNEKAVAAADDEKSQPIPNDDVTQVAGEQAQSESSSTDSSFTFSFNEMRFINENAFDFTDFSVDPIYQRTLFIDTFEVGALSNNKKKQQEKTPYTLVGRSNKYANFNLAGTLQPFAALPTYYIKGDFKEFSLPAISTYLKPSTGLEIKTGQLNTALDVTLTGDELDGNVVVLLQALETGLVDSEEAGNLINQGALPLNMAMGMLKDGDGNVELDVPLSGSTSDPSFGMSSIVTLITKKAIYSATQDYLMTTFVPYANIVSIAITAGEFALKLRFDDLEYQEKQIEPDQKQAAYLKDFITLMQDKEDTRVTICAISTPADIDLKAGVSVTDKADIKKLIDIGEKREHAFKDYLIEEGNINSSRILFCSPQIDSDEGAIPRIAISV